MRREQLASSHGRIKWRWSGLLLLPWLAASLAAQTDYRNLDDERPAFGEDAFPIERRAVELMFPGRFTTEDGRRAGTLDPEVMAGFLPNGMLGFKAPISFVEGSATQLGGLRLFALWNPNPESRSLPAFALRSDVTVPVGSGGGNGVLITLKGIATRTFGSWRAHLNAAGTIGPADAGPTRDTPERWFASAIVDHTLWRRSLLLLGEVAVSRPLRSDDVAVLGTLGLRWQWTPSLVLDAGVVRRLGAVGPDLGLTLGLSHTLAFRRLLPARPSPGSSGHTEWIYYPGRFNWRFLATYPEAARLFHAFDYGHAVLYESLWRHPDDATAALAREYRFLTEELLRHPPRYGVAEEVIEPGYARLAWRAKEAFDWAHVLHRQLYDLYSDDRLTEAARDSLVERVTDYYLARGDVAFTVEPKAMALMDEQPFSQRFKRAHPRFNGLIWAYHWLQVGLYEPLVTGRTAAEREAGVRAVLDRFWWMLEDPDARFPSVMPMTPAIAPAFTARHPRAAAIFDNLHMMHDIISDVLIDPGIPRSAKGAEIERQLAAFRDGSRDLMGDDHWRMMGEMMGGVHLMGGSAADLLPAADR